MSQPSSKLSRRRLFAGAGTAGAVAAVASLLPSTRELPVEPAPSSRQAPERGGGYSLTEHVQRYYRTTRV